MTEDKINGIKPVCADTWTEGVREEVMSENDWHVILDYLSGLFDSGDVIVIAIGRKGMDYIVGTTAEPLRDLSDRARKVCQGLDWHRVYVRHTKLDSWFC